MKTQDIESDLYGSDFPEAVDAIRQIWRSVPDKYDAVFPVYVREDFERLTWVGTSTRWGRAARVGLFWFVLVMLFPILTDGPLSDVLIDRFGPDPKDLVAGIYIVWLVLTVVTMIAIWGLFRWIDNKDWQRLDARWTMFRAGNEYRLLEAARRARERLEDDYEDGD